MIKKKNMKLATKLGLGFALTSLILIIAVGTSILQVGKTSTATNRVMELRAPTAQASLMMLNGIILFQLLCLIKKMQKKF